MISPFTTAAIRSTGSPAAIARGAKREKIKMKPKRFMPTLPIRVNSYDRITWVRTSKSWSALFFLSKIEKRNPKPKKKPEMK